MNTQVSTAATLPADELARVTQVFTAELPGAARVFGDASPPGTSLLGKVTVGTHRRPEPHRDLIYALGDPYYPKAWAVSANAGGVRKRLQVASLKAR